MRDLATHKAGGFAKVFDLGALYREAMRHGHPTIYRSSWQAKHAACIERHLGDSVLKTKTHHEDTPERALFLAIEEARLWGLPDLEVKV